jgi:hypothetical protein
MSGRDDKTRRGLDWESNPALAKERREHRQLFDEGVVGPNGPDPEPPPGFDQRAPPSGALPAHETDLVLTLMSGASYVPQQIEWLWNGYLPKGKFVLLAGEKTAGKSTLAFTLAAILTSGGRWPDDTQAPCCDVIIWSGEDDFEDTILPRFLAAGGNPKRLYPVTRVIEKARNAPLIPALISRPCAMRQNNCRISA